MIDEHDDSGDSAEPGDAGANGETGPALPVPKQTPLYRAANRGRYQRQELITEIQDVTGRKLIYVNGSYTTRINELSEEESAAVLRFLVEHVKNPNFHVRFRWEPHSVAFWDNRCTQHYAVADYFPRRRIMQRVTIAGDRPSV